MRCLGWASPVVIGDKVTRDSATVIFAQEYDVIQCILAKCPVESFKLSVRIGCVIRSRQSLDLQYLLEPNVEVAAITFPFRAGLSMSELPEDSFVVVDQESR